MINWQFFPKCTKTPQHIVDMISVFEKNLSKIDSASNKLKSASVLAVLRDDLEAIGYKVEKDKTRAGKVRIPVLFGRNGKPERSFDADAYNYKCRTVLEVEAGRGVTNFQFLKDLFQACVMVDTDFLGIALRNTYSGQDDFENAVKFLDALYSSDRLKLPLKGVVIIGY